MRGCCTVHRSPQVMHDQLAPPGGAVPAAEYRGPGRPDGAARIAGWGAFDLASGGGGLTCSHRAVPRAQTSEEPDRGRGRRFPSSGSMVRRCPSASRDLTGSGGGTMEEGPSWRKSSYSGNGGGLRRGRPARCACSVRDTQDRAGRCSVHRPLARVRDRLALVRDRRVRPSGRLCRAEAAHRGASGRFAGVPGCFRASWAGAVPGCRRARCGFRGGRGRRGMRVGPGARSAPSGRGEGREGSGGTGEPGFGGFPGSPGSLAGFRVRQVRRGMRGRCRALSTVIRAAGRVVVLGRQDRGLGENLEPGRGFPGPGGFRVFPQCVSVLVSPVVCLLAEQSCSVPDLALLSC